MLMLMLMLMLMVNSRSKLVAVPSNTLLRKSLVYTIKWKLDGDSQMGQLRKVNTKITNK